MARRIPDSLVRRKNPAVFGEDPIKWGLTGLGAGVVGRVQDRVIGPLIAGIIPGGMNAGNAIGKALDGVFTIGTGYLLGEVASGFSKEAEMYLKDGGGFLGSARIFSAALPSYSVSINFPDIPFIPGRVAVSPPNGMTMLPAAGPGGASSANYPPVTGYGATPPSQNFGF